jgi:guanylate kinase
MNDYTLAERIGDKLIVVSGPSGSGKTTFVNRIVETYPNNFFLSVSATTRNPRPLEKVKEQYIHMTEDEFLKGVSAGQFLEFARYGDHYYGTPLQPVLEAVDEGKNVILEIDVQGKDFVERRLRRRIKSFFVLPPTIPELLRRIKKRGTDSKESIYKRLVRGFHEIERIAEFDFVLFLENLDKSVVLFKTLVDNYSVFVQYNIAHVLEIQRKFLDELEVMLYEEENR